jgi:hypothetical protein
LNKKNGVFGLIGQLRVYQQRTKPPLSQLPIELDATVIPELLDGDRSLRKNASEFFSIFNHCYLALSSNKYDTFFSHAWRDKPFLSHIHRRLVRMGYKVWYDQSDMGHDLKKNIW